MVRDCKRLVVLLVVVCSYFVLTKHILADSETTSPQTQNHPGHPDHPKHPEHPDHPDHPHHPKHPDHPKHGDEGDDDDGSDSSGSDVTTSAVTHIGFDTNMIININGRKVFPIGLTLPPPPTALAPNGLPAWQELKNNGILFVRSGVNTAWDAAGIATEKQYQDTAAKYGLYCQCYLRSLGAPTTQSAKDQLKAIVNTFKANPGLGIWKGADEPWLGKVPVTAVQSCYQVIKANDLDHPVWIVQAPRGTPADLQPYNVGLDILGIDIYPVGYPPGGHSNLSNKEISMVGDFTDIAFQTAAGKKPVWMTLQIAFSGNIPPAKRLRFPDFTQERFMAYQAIIHGARGLQYFGGTIAATLNSTDTPLGFNWTFFNNVLKRLLLEIGDKSTLQPALVAPNSTYPITVNNGIEFIQRVVGTDLYIIACKREGTTLQATFSGIPAGYTSGDVIYEAPAKVGVTNGA
ncbi:MAG TPA: hypothetical protein VL282_03675, partial [Tepidisphaeraceae bacterium]|nr:hypothetical protein [Tepidisphaeraceae bacterium]